MITWLQFGVYMASVVAALFIGIEVGKSSGRAWERLRVVNLIYQSFNEGTLSATARRILHSTVDGHAKLISKDAMFGERPRDAPPPPCDHDPVPTSAGPFCSKCGDEL